MVKIISSDVNLNKKTSKPKSLAGKLFSGKKNVNPSIILMRQLADKEAKKIAGALAIQKKEQILERKRVAQIKKGFIRRRSSKIFDLNEC